MLGTITSIEEIQGIEIVSPVQKTRHCLPTGKHIVVDAPAYMMSGYKIETSEHTFYVLIDSEQQCCEDCGYVVSEDAVINFIGSTLYSVTLTDTKLNTYELPIKLSGYENVEEVQFVDFATSTGTFQLAVYNAHNGCYGHSILILKDDEPILSERI